MHASRPSGSDFAWKAGEDDIFTIRADGEGGIYDNSQGFELDRIIDAIES